MKTTTALVYDHHGRDNGQVEIRVTVGKKLYYFSTGVKVPKSCFVAGQVVNVPGARELNDRLSILYSKVCAEVNDCLDNHVAVDAEDIRRKVWNIIEEKDGDSVVIDWINSQLPLLGVSDGTLRHYYTLVRRLDEFGEIRKWKDVTVENICNFDAWLHSLDPALCDATIFNYHKDLKALLFRADRFGKIERNPYERLKGKFSKGEKESIEYLTEDEMQRFCDVVVPEGTPLDRAHDLFIFQMYTGLSYSDSQAFDMSLYKWDGKRWVHSGERVKTGVPYVSVLLPPVIKVLEKYGMKVPYLNNVEYNKQLKSLGVIAGISTNMHSHLARHTFATMMLRNGAKIENVARMLGHTNISQTQRYAKVLAKSVMDDFDVIEQKMKGKA